MSQQFPQLVIVYNELEIAHTVQERDEYLHALSSAELADVILLDKHFNYTTLSNKQCNALSQQQLALVVTRYLANEGHCCLGKITVLTPRQAFSLLAL
jgi:hypothetical protein